MEDRNASLNAFVVNAILVGMITFFGMPRSQAAMQPVAPEFSKVLYTAKMMWDGEAGMEKLRFKLGTMRGKAMQGKSAIGAVITGSKGQVRAVCSRILARDTTSSYDQIAMSCSGALFPKAAITTFTFPRKLEHPLLEVASKGLKKQATLVFED